MSIKDNKALLQRYFQEIWNESNRLTADEIIHPDFKTRFPETNGVGAEGIYNTVQARKEAFPDLHFEILHILSEDNSVFVHYRFTGTHEGEFWGIQPTGKRVSYDGVAMFTIINGQLLAIGSVRDELALLEQIEAVPSFVRDNRQ